MANHIQVVLKEDVNNLGLSGELVRVRPGFARNFLIPRGMAVIASRSNVQQVKHERALALQRAEKRKRALEEQAVELKKLTLQIAKEAGDEGRLFGSVTAQDVAEALEKRDMDVDRRKLIMPEQPIKEVGPYTIGLKLGPGVVAEFKLDVKTKA